MNLTGNLNLRGQHALFSPSQPSWLNYDATEFLDKLIGKYRSGIGTEIHDWASVQIALGHKITSVRELYKDIETHIYTKYFDAKYYDISKYAKSLIKALKYIPTEVFETAKTYVNHSIGFHMEPEVLIDYSDYFFGTADAVSFDGHVLRINDLKTGNSQPHIEQLMIYACLFYLKNDFPNYKELSTELRIYQNNDILLSTPTSDDLLPIFDKIITFNKLMIEFNGGA